MQRGSLTAHFNFISARLARRCINDMQRGSSKTPTSMGLQRGYTTRDRRSGVPENLVRCGISTIFQRNEPRAVSGGRNRATSASDAEWLYTKTLAPNLTGPARPMGPAPQRGERPSGTYADASEQPVAIRMPVSHGERMRAPGRRRIDARPPEEPAAASRSLRGTGPQSRERTVRCSSGARDGTPPNQLL
jgi:hypothetical protein